LKQRIPCDFSRTYLKDFEGSARIRKLGDDRSWKIEVKYERKGDNYVVNKGWNPFTKEYNLKADDVCKFEMTHSKPPCFTITITRA
jgi:hypothetical protein